MVRPQAISKTEASKQLSVVVEYWLKNAIFVINERLQNFSGGVYTINDSDIGLENLSSAAQTRAITEIHNIYCATEWKVSHEYGDPRDPEGWFTFW